MSDKSFAISHLKRGQLVLGRVAPLGNARHRHNTTQQVLQWSFCSHELTIGPTMGVRQSITCQSDSRFQILSIPLSFITSCTSKVSFFNTLLALKSRCHNRLLLLSYFFIWLWIPYTSLKPSAQSARNPCSLCIWGERGPRTWMGNLLNEHLVFWSFHVRKTEKRTK